MPQVIWVIDGEPFALADPDDTVYWPMRPGAHRIQLRLPLRDGASRMIKVVVVKGRGTKKAASKRVRRRPGPQSAPYFCLAMILSLMSA